MARALQFGLVILLLLGFVAPTGAFAAQIDRNVRDRVVPAAVEVAAAVRWQEGSFDFDFPLPVGSGTVVSADGLILTNHHVIDGAELGSLIADWSEELKTDSPGVTISLVPDTFLILSSDGINPPETSFTAQVVADDPVLDLAVLKIVADDSGSDAAIAGVTFPFVPLGDSDTVGLGDRVHVFSYPSIGGDALTYTDGVVSGFQREDGVSGVAWITTDAVMSGGSSGGTAINEAGELIGVPTQGTELDCRPGDTNRDGAVDMEDIGCIPTGGSLGQLRPINQAKALLAEVGASPAPTSQAEVVSTRVPDADGAVDLPRLALSPIDLAELGFDGYVLRWSQYVDARGTANLLSLPVEWERDIVATGLLGSYLLASTLPEENGSATTISSIVFAYPDAAAAAEGFQLTEEAAEASTVARDEPPGRTLGDESEITTWDYTDSESGEALLAVEVTVRQGDLVGLVRRNGPAASRAALLADAEVLGEAMAQRMAEPAGAETLPLSARVVRVVDEGIGGSIDYYMIQDGEAVPTSWYQEPSGAAEWMAYWNDIGVVGGYETEIFLPTEAQSAPGRVGVRLYDFSDVPSADAYIAAYKDDLASAAENVTELSNVPSYADNSHTFAFETDWWDDVDPEYRIATVMRSGTTVAALEIAANAPIPMGVVKTLASAQEACLVQGCTDLTMNAPAWLLGLKAPEQSTEVIAEATVVVTPASQETPTPTPAPQPTASPTPIPSPTPLPTPTQIPAEEPFAWGIDETFNDPTVVEASDSDVSAIAVHDGMLTMTIKGPGDLDGFVFSDMPTEGRDVSLTATILDTAGLGEITLRFGTEDEAIEWFFAIDPVNKEWSLYRSSTATQELFYWVEPRSFSSLAPGPVQRLEVALVGGEPTLLINGVDVVAPTGIDMPAMPGNQLAGFGAGINPESVPAGSGSFSVDFARVALVELGE